MRELRRMGIVRRVVNNKTVTHEVLSRENWGMATSHLAGKTLNSTALNKKKKE